MTRQISNPYAVADRAAVLSADSPLRGKPMVVWPEFMAAIGYPGTMPGLTVVWYGHHFQVTHKVLLSDFVENEWGRLIEREPGK